MEPTHSRSADSPPIGTGRSRLRGALAAALMTAALGGSATAAAEESDDHGFEAVDHHGHSHTIGPRVAVHPEAESIVREIVFPVEGDVYYSDTFGACRSGCSRSHEGQDLMGSKMQRLISTVDGVVVGFKQTASSNYLMIQDSEGWTYWYIHINNDTPGTDDGLGSDEYAFAPGIGLGSEVRRGQWVAYMGDSGNAEHTPPHLHFEIHTPPEGTSFWQAPVINPYKSLQEAEHMVWDPTGGGNGIMRWTSSEYATPTDRRATLGPRHR